MMRQTLQKNKTKANSVVAWGAMRRQIDEVNQKLATSEEINLAALGQTWARRSAQIARKIESEQQGEIVKVAIISLDNQLYGLDVQYIFDIRVMERITFIPRLPAWILGVVNWRGRILSVINLRCFLGLPSNKGTETRAKTAQHLVVLKAGEIEVGILADEVFLIASIPVNKIDTSDGVVRAIKPEFVNGLFIGAGQETKNPMEIIVLLNLLNLLADPRLVSFDEIL